MMYTTPRGTVRRCCRGSWGVGTMGMQPYGTGIRLRPMGLGDVLDETFRVYRRQFVAFILTMGIVAVPSAALGLLSGIASAMANTRGPSIVDPLLLLILIIPLAIVAMLAQLVAGGAAVQIASNTILGYPVDVKEAYSRAFSHLGGLFVAGLLTFLALFGLIITCIGIPFAVYFGLGWGLVYPAVMLEDLGGTGAMRRSSGLVKEHRLRLLVCWIIIGLIMSILINIPGGLVSMVTGIWIGVSQANTTVVLIAQTLNALAQAAGQTVFGSIAFITMTLFYYELRVRKEGFDLQQRAMQGGAPQQWQQGQWQQGQQWQPQPPQQWQQPQPQQPQPWQQPVDPWNQPPQSPPQSPPQTPPPGPPNIPPPPMR